MRYLNKIVFINSATIKYAEVNLDGNVHLIGTQGVGKSTLLRSILFFYNADTQKLGIPKEKKNYTEYYFPYANSYVLYEVNTEVGPFCILSFKSQGRISFRFFDGPYKQKYFVGPDKIVYDSWEYTRAILDAGKVKYSNKIDRYEEYKDILYGNTDGKNNSLKKYALLESKQYQNIPRTIQNVLLNSKLDAEFIKQTIIMSLNEEDIQIELSNYTHHLKGFETQLNDIKQFKLPSVTKQADTVALLLNQVKTLEREKITLAGYLSWAYQHALDTQPKLKDKVDKEEAAKQVIIEKLEKASLAFKEKESEKSGEISVLDNHIKTAKKKADEYEWINIKSIIVRVVKKAEQEAAEKNLLAEREILSAQYKDITKKYEDLIKEIENQLIEYKNTKNGEKVDLGTTFQTFQNDIRQQSDKQVNEINVQFKVEIQAAREHVSTMHNETHTLNIKKEGIKHRRYYEEEIDNLNKDLREYNANQQKATSQIKLLKAEIEMLQKEWNNDNERKQEAFQNQKDKLDEKIKALQTNIGTIEAKIANNKNSLYGWLDEQNPQWAETIGKVIDEELLFQNNLSPQLSKKTDASLYGITLNLTEINKKVKTLTDYEDEKAALIKQVERLRNEQNELIDANLAEGEKLRKKYQSKINQTKDAIQEQEYFHGVTSSHLNQTTLALSDYAAKAKVEKQQALTDIDVAIHKAEKSEADVAAELLKIEEEQKKKIKAKEKETDNRIKAERLGLTDALGLIDAAIHEKINSHQEHKNSLLNNQKDELSAKGADTKRIEAVNQQLAVIKNELDFIEKNRDKVVEYHKDKREWFDKVEENKTQKQLFEQQLAIETQKYQARKDEMQKSLKSVTDSINGIERALDEMKRDVDAFENFILMDWWGAIAQSDKEVKEKNKTAQSASQLIMVLMRCHGSGNERLDDLKAAINKFTSYFSAQNIFKFKTSFTETEHYLQFADELRSFMEDAKISEYEKRTNEQYASVIRSIGHETTNLVSKSGEIKKIITQINNDFERKNFVGAIKKIELNIDESANKIVQLLIKIKTFNDEHSFDLGASNLFTTDNQESKNKLATELLKQLLKEINGFKGDHISLSDSFELKFRVIENQNDTGWVEKLSNVGSEGTDILVKAMVNIMLLNVFKEGASKSFKDFRLHCMMDEIGKLHPNNVKGILQFANDRNIYLINGSPTENNAVNYKHIYKLEKDDKSFTRVKRILTNHA